LSRHKIERTVPDDDLQAAPYEIVQYLELVILNATKTLVFSGDEWLMVASERAIFEVLAQLETVISVQVLHRSKTYSRVYFTVNVFIKTDIYTFGRKSGHRC